MWFLISPGRRKSGDSAVLRMYLLMLAWLVNGSYTLALQYSGTYMSKRASVVRSISVIVGYSGCRSSISRGKTWEAKGNSHDQDY